MVHSVWAEFLKIAKDEAGSRVVETWFKAVTLYRWDAWQKTVVLQAPNQFVRDWIKSHYCLLIETHLKRLFNVDEIKIVFTENGATEQSTQEATENAVVPAVHAAPAKTIVPIEPTHGENGLGLPATLGKNRGYINRAYSFDTFVVGPNNSLAYAAAKAMSERPGTIYNPLFIYGDSGLGKTHLLHAIGNAIKEKYAKAVVLYQTADRFVNEFINAIRFDKVHKFQEKYKAVDVLLIDDIQFISNKEQTQEAFFHIFNTLYDAQKQIVFSSDTYPQNIQGLAERLRFRLAWGLVVDMHVPTLETKIAILKRKAELSNEYLDDEVAHFIASRVVSNIRELEGSLIRVIAFASLTHQPITLDLARKVLVRIQETIHNSVCFERIVKCLHKYYACNLELLRSKKRNKEISFVRQVAMFLMKKMTDKSLRDIGVFLGGRDHSTVMHALDKIEQHIKDDQEFKDRIAQIENDILSSPH